jgi:hypothetical protein
MLKLLRTCCGRLVGFVEAEGFHRHKFAYNQNRVLERGEIVQARQMSYDPMRAIWAQVNREINQSI